MHIIMAILSNSLLKILFENLIFLDSYIAS